MKLDDDPEGIEIDPGDLKEILRSRVRPGVMVEAGDPTENEDWIKQSWPFLRHDGTPVDTLEELGNYIGWPAGSSLAREILTQPFGRHAPAALIEEARRAEG